MGAADVGLSKRVAGRFAGPQGSPRAAPRDSWRAGSDRAGAVGRVLAALERLLRSVVKSDSTQSRRRLSIRRMVPW